MRTRVLPNLNLALSSVNRDQRRSLQGAGLINRAATPLTAGLIANLWDTEENINKNATEIIELVRGMAWSRGTKPDIRTIWNGFEARKRSSIVDWWRALTGRD